MNDGHPETHEVAALLAEHDAHHSGMAHPHADNDNPRCHAVDEHMAGVPSQHVENTVQRVIDNALLGTPEQSLKAIAWAKRKGIPAPKAANDTGWTQQVVANDSIAHCDRTAG